MAKVGRAAKKLGVNLLSGPLNAHSSQGTTYGKLGAHSKMRDLLLFLLLESGQRPTNVRVTS